MFQTVELPLWLLVLILGFAVVTFASHFLFPSVRWFFRRRLERGVERLNQRLARPIRPFKLARRHDMIQRLSYDTQVMAAVADHAAQHGVPESVAFERAQRYAREIVPAFSAAAYFGFAIRAARFLSTKLYHLRIDEAQRDRIQAIDADATVVFVMNHRSNMDYVLVTYLVASDSALSYAVGEWARIWPLRILIRAMGAYFIRRRSRDDLYRRVLARYVQLATANGVTQAIFPEGGLSLDGRMAPPKLGLIHYITDGADLAARDIVFVPVAVNYDRVLEDRILLEAGARGERRFNANIGEALAVSWRVLRRALRGQDHRFGMAGVGFGAPISLRDMGPEPEALGQEVMRRIAAAMPILPVPLVAEALLTGPMSQSALLRHVTQRAETLRAGGAAVRLPQGRVPKLLDAALTILLRRGIVVEGADGLWASAPEAGPILTYYANSIRDAEQALGLPACQVEESAKT
ncbi:MAG: glycerol-3-phosphate acyltransferase [Confluentimicrobium sp.]|nr:glycerol-3-phosphate acyltransferase [Actibacterium sp.]